MQLFQLVILFTAICEKVTSCSIDGDFCTLNFIEVKSVGILLWHLGMKQRVDKEMQWNNAKCVVVYQKLLCERDLLWEIAINRLLFGIVTQF